MSSKTKTSPWPKGFIWGTSTSSYQIEGAAKEGGRGPSIWDVYSQIAGKIANGDTGDVACDHYHRYAEDIGLMKQIGLDAYRFSVAWPRVLPTGRGRVNETGLDFYDRLIDGLLAAKIEPWLCLYHWDLPLALGDEGGWINRDTAGWFADYAALIARRYGDRVKRWATFNEFSVFTIFGFALDGQPPGISDRVAHLKAIHHTNLAHGLGVDVVRSLVPGASIGAVHNRQRIVPESQKPEDVAAAGLLDEHWNLVFPDPQILGHYPTQTAKHIEPIMQAGDMAKICRPLDWFGINHYGPIFIKKDDKTVWGYGWGATPADAPVSEIGWAIFPDMFRDELIEIDRKYKLPIYVTENGAGSHDAPDGKGAVDDHPRISYLTAYTDAMKDAIKTGADVRGYFVWSLLDNFEWSAGYANRFGLVYVDFKTQRRIPKSSSRWYADLIKSAKAG